jgi:hypothetical protein
MASAQDGAILISSPDERISGPVRTRLRWREPDPNHRFRESQASARAFLGQ